MIVMVTLIVSVTTVRKNHNNLGKFFIKLIIRFRPIDSPPNPLRGLGGFRRKMS